MLFALGTVALLAVSALAGGGNTGPIPPHLRGCGNITVQAAGNCPKRGFECDEEWPIRYSVHNDNWARAEVKCVDRNAYLAVDEQIVESVRCRDKKWRAEGNCDIPTTSVVCAKYCDADNCPASLHRAPRRYEELTVFPSSNNHACAIAKCKYGIAVLARNGTLLKELPSTTTLTCSGDGKWAVSATEKYSHCMCNRRPKSCSHNCDEQPYVSATLNVTSAVRNGCSYSCPEGAALTRLDGAVAIALTCATCTRRGFEVDNDFVVQRIGCLTCDVRDGPVRTVPTVPGLKPATASGCVLTCTHKKHTVLRYGRRNVAKSAPGNILYRTFSSTGNGWITSKGDVITADFWVGCARKEDCEMAYDVDDIHLHD